jgi:cobalt-zinc-cadmium efflux system membrane fusion protein
MTTTPNCRRVVERALTLCLALHLVACQQKTAPREGGASSSTPSPSTSVVVAPELLASGRIAVAAAALRVPTPELEAPGEVRSGAGDEALVTSLVAGRVADLRGNVGDHVKKGDALVTVQAPEVARLRAEERRAQARLELAKRSVARMTELQAEGAGSQASLENARADMQSVLADRDALRTQLSGLGLASDAAEGPNGPSTVILRSPIEGVIVERRALLGSSVAPGEFLYRIVTAETHGVLVHLPESYAAHVSVGSRVRVRPREAEVASAMSCDATVERMTGIVDEARTMAIRLELDAACSLHGTGRSLTVSIPLRGAAAPEPVLMVPAEAVVALRGKAVLFVQSGETSSFAWRAVRLGDHVGAFVVVEDGLRVGERVVVRGTVLLKGEVLRAEPLE